MEKIMKKNEWVEYGLTWDDFCWKKDELAKAGTLVDVEGKIYLIGDINEVGGVCDDCMDFEKSVTVSRYKKIKIDKE
jgi:hypothetical protein